MNIDVGHYISKGFVAIPGLLSSSDVLLIRADCERVLGALGGHSVPPLALTQLHLTFDWAYRLATNTLLLDCAKSLLGDQIFIWSTSVFFKPAGSELFVDWHQDSKYWRMGGGVTSAWIALTPSTKENGCLQVIPGTHLMGNLQHGISGAANNMLARRQRAVVPEPTLSAAVSIELAPGDVSFHHPLVLHSSSQNQAQHDRIGFVIRYVGANVVFDHDYSPELVQVCGPPSTDLPLSKKSELASEFDEAIRVHRIRCKEFLEELGLSVGEME